MPCSIVIIRTQLTSLLIETDLDQCSFSKLSWNHSVSYIPVVLICVSLALYLKFISFSLYEKCFAVSFGAVKDQTLWLVM